MSRSAPRAVSPSPSPAAACDRLRMTEGSTPHISPARITVLGVQPGNPPFRIVEVDGEFVGRAMSMTDVLLVAAEVGIPIHDLDDLEVVRWVGGGKFTWTTTAM